MKGKQTKPKNVMFILRRMHRSAAFRKLSASSIFVLMEFFYRRKVAKSGREGGYEIINNGELIFTYAEAEKRFNISRSTFCRSIDQLAELGFIYIAHHGGGMLKDCSKYGISERWKEYGKSEFVEKFRQKDTRKLGFTKDNWMERVGSKRKLKSKIGINIDTRSSITNDTSKHQKLCSVGITNATHKIDPNYYIQKGLEVFEAMRHAQYH